VIAEGDDETPPHEGPAREFERDVLAERRARRAGAGETPPLARADAVEATVHALERQLADLRRRQAEAERERERMAEQLADREHELRRVKQREYAEQQLRVEAEENVTRQRRRHRAELDRLQRRVEEAHVALHSSGERAEELRVRAEEGRAEAERRQVEAERRGAQAERRHAAAERRRLQAEEQCVVLAARLAAVSASCLRMQESILTLQGAAAELRSKFEQERESARTRIDELERGRAAADARMRQLERALADARQPGGSPAQEARREEMAGALAAAVDRLRARVAAVGELDPPATDTPAGLAPETETPVAHAIQPETPAAAASTTDAPAAESPATDARAAAADASVAESPKTGEGPATGPPAVEVSATPVSEARVPVVQVVPRRLAAPIRRERWLAPAIRRVAERRDPKLAAELVAELLPAQRLVLERPLSYELRIAECEGSWHVQVGPDRAVVSDRSALGEAAVDFTLEGRAAAYAELAAGGAGRRLPGLRIDGSRRALRALRRARRRPLALWDLAEAGIDVWPGLLLLALAEAIDPSWSVGRSFTVAFAIGAATDPAGDTGVYVQVRDGAALAVTSAPREPPATTVRVSERAFTCMLAGTALPAGEAILVEGDTGLLELLIEWADRAQGRSTGQASLRRSRA
jgi:hypothetical protein